MPVAREATLPDSFHLDLDLRLLISFHLLLLIDSGSNFQMWKQQIIDNKSRAQAIWEVDKLIQLRSLHTTSPLFALVAAMHYSLLSSIKYRCFQLGLEGQRDGVNSGSYECQSLGTLIYFFKIAMEGRRNCFFACKGGDQEVCYILILKVTCIRKIS